MSFVLDFWEKSKEFENDLAFVSEEERVSFKEFKERISFCVGGLKALGLEKGNIILLAVPVSISFYVHIVAAWHLGLQVVLNEEIRNKERLKNNIEDLGIKFIITTKKLSFLKYFFLPASCWRITKWAPKKKYDKKPKELGSDHIALLTSTTGSTGKPKVAQRTVGFLTTQFDTIQEILQIEQGDKHLSSFPVVLLCNLLVGATSIYLPKKKFDSFLDKLLKESPLNIISASPFFINAISEKIDFHGVRATYVGGASVYRPLAEKLRPYAQKTTLIYGSTEAEPIALCTLSNFLNSDKSERGILVGVVHSQLQIRILDERDGIGEIAVAGNHVLPKENLAHAKYLYESIEGKDFYRTGDLGYVKDGQLFFYGRKKFSWIYNNELYSPVWCEKWNGYNPIFTEATMLQIGDENVVFYVGDKQQEDSFKGAVPFKIHKFIQVAELPKDIRHRSRINYSELIAQFIKS